MFRKLFIAILLFFALALVVASYGAQLSPSVFWPLGFSGLAFYGLLAVNVFLLFLSVFRPGWYSLIPFLAIALCYQSISNLFSFHLPVKPQNDNLKVMTWNVRNFDLYNWSNNKGTRLKMMEQIRRERPDILCMQEYYTDNSIDFNNTGYLRDSLGMKYFYFRPTAKLTIQPKSKIHKILWKNKPLQQQWGLAIFSRYPITDTGHIHFENSHLNDCIFANVIASGKTYTVYSTHFQSVKLDADDYVTLQALEENAFTSRYSFYKIISKMKHAYKKRGEQVDLVKEHVAQCKHPVLLCGDFNDPPISYSYNQLTENLRDAFVEKGFGVGSTYLHRLSLFRIDYILHSPSLSTHSYYRIKNTLSDHYPVVATFNTNLPQ